MRETYHELVDLVEEGALVRGLNLETSVLRLDVRDIVVHELPLPPMSAFGATYRGGKKRGRERKRGNDTHIELSFVQADHEVHLVEFGEGVVDLFDDADDAVVRFHDGMDGSLPGRIEDPCVSTARVLRSCSCSVCNDMT